MSNECISCGAPFDLDGCAWCGREVQELKESVEDIVKAIWDTPLDNLAGMRGTDSASYRLDMISTNLDAIKVDTDVIGHTCVMPRIDADLIPTSYEPISDSYKEESKNRDWVDIVFITVIFFLFWGMVVGCIVL